MYGPERHAICTAMEQLMRDHIGYPQDTMAIYLAANAMATMTMFGSSEADGHFHWCAGILRRPDVLSALQAGRSEVSAVHAETARDCGVGERPRCGNADTHDGPPSQHEAHLVGGDGSCECRSQLGNVGGDEP